MGARNIEIDRKIDTEKEMKIDKETKTDREREREKNESERQRQRQRQKILQSCALLIKVRATYSVRKCATRISLNFL